MENQTFWTVTIKWALIYIAITTAFGWASYFAFDLDGEGGVRSIPGWVMVIPAIVGYVALFVVLFQAFREYDRRTGSTIKAGQAFGMGLSLLLLSNVVSIVLGRLLMSEADSAMMTSEMFYRAYFFQLVFQFLIIVVYIMIISVWRLFEKAGKPGWGSIVPIYNAVLTTQIAKRPEVWVVLLFIPFVNIVIAIMLANGVSKAFGKDEVFTVGLVLLPFIFYPMIGFGDAYWIYGPEQPAADSDWQLEDNLVS